MMLVAIAAGTGCGGETSDQNWPGNETISSDAQALSLQCEGSAQACFGLSPEDCYYQHGCSRDSAGFCIGIATECASLREDDCADQLGCFIPYDGPGPAAPPPPRLFTAVSNTVRLGSPVEVYYAAPGDPSTVYEVQIKTPSTAWRRVESYSPDWGGSFYVTPQLGINQYWVRLCRNGCGPETDFAIEAYPEDSSLYTTWNRPPVSEEGSGVSLCFEGTGVVGLGCSGGYCDNVTLRCGDPARKTLPSTVRTHSDMTWTSFFSEESDPTRICPQGRMVVGIGCSGQHCDNIRLACAPHRANSHRRNCAWSSYYSEETAPFVSAKNTAVFGVQCGKQFCDDKRYYTCEIADGPAPPPPPTLDGSACTWVPSTSAAHNGGHVEVSRPQGACPYSYREKYYSSKGQLVNTVYR